MELNKITNSVKNFFINSFNKIKKYSKEKPKSFIITTIVIIIAIFLFCSVFNCQGNGNIKRYSYTSSTGEVSTFEINFDKGEYKYTGNACYSPNWGYMIIPNTSFEVSGRVRLEHKINGFEVYSFSNHPWNYEHTMGISSDGKILEVEVVSGALYYDFVLEE